MKSNLKKNFFSLLYEKHITAHYILISLWCMPRCIRYVYERCIVEVHSSFKLKTKSFTLLTVGISLILVPIRTFYEFIGIDFL